MPSTTHSPQVGGATLSLENGKMKMTYVVSRSLKSQTPSKV